MELRGRKILITGAASGIGLAIAKMFVAEGARVAMMDRKNAVHEACQKIGAAPDTALAFVADVSVRTQVQSATTEALAAFGGLDGLVNVAGRDLIGPFSEATPDEIDNILNVNLIGAMTVTSSCLHALKQANGATIVNIASAAGLKPLGGRSVYCASKAGLVMFGKALSIELAESKIRVNSICPGIIDTPAFRWTFENAADPAAELKKIRERYLLEGPARPEEIAYAALYLTSDRSSFVTGSSLAVDGGRCFH